MQQVDNKVVTLPLIVNPITIFFIKLAHSESEFNIDTSHITRYCSGPREKVIVQRPFCQSVSFTEWIAFDNCGVDKTYAFVLGDYLLSSRDNIFDGHLPFPVRRYRNLLLSS